MSSKSLFTDQYEFKGKYEEYARALINVVDNQSNVKLFNSAVELYVTSAVVGLSEGNRLKPANDSKQGLRIFPDQIKNHRKDCMFVFRLIMLLYDNPELTPRDRINNAFKYPDMDDQHNVENMKVFEEYMLGGLASLYDSLIGNNNKRYEDYLSSVNSLIKNFNSSDETDLTDDVDYDTPFL